MKNLIQAVTGVALLLVVVTGAQAGEAVAEELRSIDLCRQAVALERQRGGEPDLNCSIDYVAPVFYWQCVVGTLKQGGSLATAQSTCR